MKVCLCNSSSVLCEYPPYPWKKLDIDHKSPYNIMFILKCNLTFQEIYIENIIA